MVLPQPVTVASVPGRSRASTPGVTSWTGAMPLMGEARWITAASKLKVTGSHLGVDVDGGGPALLALGAGEHGAPDHHPQVAEGDPAGHADEVDAVGGRQDLERVIRLPPQYWRWKSLSPKDWARSTAWNLYLPLGTAVPPTILGVTARRPGGAVRPGLDGQPLGRRERGRSSGQRQHEREARDDDVHPSSDDVSVDATAIPFPSEQAPTAIGASRLRACPTPSSSRSARTGSRPPS